MVKCKKAAVATKPLSLRQRWNAVKPVRPTRPAQGFSKFVAEFSKGNGGHHGPRLLQEASFAWNQLDDNEKVQYASPDEMAEYELEMAEYRAVIQAMKQPAGPFGLFVQNYWQNNKSKGTAGKKNFGLIQKKIADAWAKTDKRTKDKYKTAADELKALFRREQEEVLATGRPINVNWRDGAGKGGQKDRKSAPKRK